MLLRAVWKIFVTFQAYVVNELSSCCKSYPDTIIRLTASVKSEMGSSFRQYFL